MNVYDVFIYNIEREKIDSKSERRGEASVAMKRKQIFIVLALGVLLVVIMALSIRNDCRFYKQLLVKDRETLNRDSLMNGQMDSITISLNEATAQLDSIRREQKEYNRKEDLNTDTIKTSLTQINRIGSQIHNLMK